MAGIYSTASRLHGNWFGNNSIPPPLQKSVLKLRKILLSNQTLSSNDRRCTTSYHRACALASLLQSISSLRTIVLASRWGEHRHPIKAITTSKGRARNPLLSMLVILTRTGQLVDTRMNYSYEHSLLGEDSKDPGTVDALWFFLRNHVLNLTYFFSLARF